MPGSGIPNNFHLSTSVFSFDMIQLKYMPLFLSPWSEIVIESSVIVTIFLRFMMKRAAFFKIDLFECTKKPVFLEPHGLML
jgi:hypothetical protein